MSDVPNSEMTPPRQGRWLFKVESRHDGVTVVTDFTDGSTNELRSGQYYLLGAAKGGGCLVALGLMVGIVALTVAG